MSRSSRSSIPPHGAPASQRRSAARRASFDDIPTTPYGIPFPEEGMPAVTREPPDAITGFFVTAEAAPLIPLLPEESRVRSKSSLSPVALSAPPDATPSPGESASSWTLLWGRRWLIAGAAAAAFTVALVAGRLTASHRAPVAAATEPAPAKPEPVRAAQPGDAPAPEPLPAEPAPPSAAADTGQATHAKTKHRVRAATIRVVAKRPFTPSEI